MNIDNFYTALLNNSELQRVSPLFKVFIVTYESFIASTNNQELEALENIFNEIKLKYPEQLEKIVDIENNETTASPQNWIKEKHELIDNAAQKCNLYLDNKPELPSLKEQASNFISGMKDFATSGFKTVTKEQYEERKKICLDCKFFDPSGFGGIGRCRKCGCADYKLNIAASYCPIGLWGSIE